MEFQDFKYCMEFKWTPFHDHHKNGDWTERTSGFGSNKDVEFVELMVRDADSADSLKQFYKFSYMYNL